MESDRGNESEDDFVIVVVVVFNLLFCYVY